MVHGVDGKVDQTRATRLDHPCQQANEDGWSGDKPRRDGDRFLMVAVRNQRDHAVKRQLLIPKCWQSLVQRLGRFIAGNMRGAMEEELPQGVSCCVVGGRWVEGSPQVVQPCLRLPRLNAE